MSDNRCEQKVNVGFFRPVDVKRRKGVDHPSSVDAVSHIELIDFYYGKGEDGNLRIFRDADGRHETRKEDVESEIEAGISFHEESALLDCSFPTLAGMGGEIVSRNIFRCGYYWKTLAIVLASFIAENRDKGERVLYLNCHEELGYLFYLTIKKVLDDCEMELPDWSELTFKDYKYIVVYGYGEKYRNSLDFFINKRAKLSPDVKIYVEVNYLLYFAKKRMSLEERNWCRDHIRVVGGKDCKENDFQRFIDTSQDLIEEAVSSGNRTKKEIAEWIRNCHFYKSKEFGSLFFREDGEIFFPLYLYDGNINLIQGDEGRLSYYPKTEMTKEKAAELIKDMAQACLPLITGKLDVPEKFEVNGDEKFMRFLQRCEFLLYQATYAPLRLDFLLNYGSVRDVIYTIGYDKNKQVLDCKAIDILLGIASCEILQLNVEDLDVEDNNTRRIYFLQQDGGKDSALRTLSRFQNKCHSEDVVVSVARSEERSNLSDANVIAGGKNLFNKIYSFSRQHGNVKFVYFISMAQESAQHSNGVVIWSKYKFTLFELQIISNLLSILFSAIESRLLKKECQKAQVQSAIGSIMSRNGSHNIGSHVLAALSHNVGTMPDDRVLYQYIQQRMDYIATATTDFPAWRQPTMLVSGMMRQFLIQRHLLDHIAGSEGLRAYQFQNRSLAPRQDRTIRIHIRRIKDNINNWANEGFLDSSVLEDKEKTVSFIRYGGQENSYNALKDNKDVAVAIPGGVVGQHAFYTIVENIVRNAAKHDWAKVAKKNSNSSESDSGNPNKEIYNLELYIDFRDNPKDGVVEFRVWTCVTENSSKIVHAQQDTKNEKNVIAEITKKICQCFIDSEGELRKENWGIAEMRISAGYLRNCDIADIGGLNNYERLGANNATMKIIRPVEVSLPDGTSALGYRFDLYKPRELLVVLPEYCNPSEDVLERVNKNANQYGVWIKRESELIKEADLSFSYVLFDSFDINNEYRQCLPFRVIASKIVANEVKQGGSVSGIKCSGGSWDSARRLIPETGSPLFRYLDDARGSSDIQKLAGDANKAKQTCDDLLDRVYGIWMAHITKKNQTCLAIDILGGGGEKKSLVTKIDLLRFVLENSFNAAAKSFLESGYGKYKSTQGESSNSEGIFEKVLNDMVSMKPREVTIGKVMVDHTSTDGIAMMAILCRQLKEWFGRLYGKTMLAKRRHDEFISSRGYSEFIKYICGPILDQAEVFLAKYEEEYSTLPEGFKVKADRTGGSWPVTIHCGVQDISVEFSSDDTKRKKLYNEGHVCYFRHSPGAAGDIRNYLEPLSGSQSYLGAFVALRDSLVNHTVSVNDERFVTTLVENATMRILIIDERVSDFMDDHEEVYNKLGGLGVSVKDDEDQEVLDLFESINAHDDEKLDKVMDSTISGVALKEFEILIIHQGIIDKLFNGHEDVDVVKEFLKALIKRMHYVVVTTGRGSPANIPDEARVLPYSVIKDTLLKCYPEKMILVGAVMNILPVRNQKATKNKKGK